MKRIKKIVVLMISVYIYSLLTGFLVIKAEFTLNYPYTEGNSILSDDFHSGLSNWMLQLGGTGFNGIQEGNNQVVKFTYPGPAEGIMTGLDDYNQLTNYTFSSKIRFDSGETSDHTAAGIVFRYKDADNMYMLRLKKSNNALELYKKDKGTWVSLSSNSIPGGTIDNDWYELKVDVVNNHIIGYLDGERLIQVSEPEEQFIYKGNFGFRTYQGNFSIDDVIVKEIKTDVTIPIPGDKDPNAGRSQLGSFENNDYLIKYYDNYSFQIVNKSTQSIGEFLANFTVISGANPSKALKQETISNNNFFWFYSWNGNSNLYGAPGKYDYLTPNSQVYDHSTNELRWTFAAQTGYTFEAKLKLVDGKYPELDYTLNSMTNTVYYSIGYTGVFDYSIDSLDWIFLPPYWSGKRTQPIPYLIDEARVGLPIAMYSVKGSSVAIAPNPDTIYKKFQLPQADNSRFGFAIQNESNRITPQYFAPIYGGAGSKFTGNYNSKLSLIVSNKTQYELYKELAVDQYKFQDYRKNLDFTLNDTLDNIMNYVLNSSGENYVYWDPNTKTYEYVNDIPGYGRQQSMIYALGLALIRDNYEMYEERALPTIEYMVSRSTQYMKIKENGYDPKYPMGGPVAGTYTDFAGLYEMTGKTNTVYKDLAIESFLNYLKTKGFNSIYDTIIDVNKNYSASDTELNLKSYLPGLIAMYKVTGDHRFLNQAIKLTDDYIDKRVIPGAKTFSGNTSSWWHEYSSRYDYLEEMYNLTNNPKYMDAAVSGMKEFIPVMNLTPTIPDGNVTIGGKTVPAWMVSEVGLTPEMGGTSNIHRAIFMPYMTGYMERMSEWSGEILFSDIARSNIIGRYANYPGYNIRYDFKLEVFEPDYPLKYYSDYVNEAHMNHPVPMAYMIVDYLVSDVYNRSNKNIHFPSVYTNTGAYFNAQVYGADKGSFYGNEDVTLWIPDQLLVTSNKQLNHIAAYDENNLYISFSNQDFVNVTSTITLNSNKVNFLPTHDVTIWYEDGTSETTSLINGVLTISAHAKGLTSIKINGATPKLEFQDEFHDLNESNTHPYASLKMDDEKLGTVGGYLLSDSAKLNTFYMYSDLTVNDTSSITFKYSFDGGQTWKEGRDTKYPFEYSVPLTGDEERIDFYLIDSDNTVSKQYWIWTSTDQEPPTRGEPNTPNPENQDLQELMKSIYKTDFSPNGLPFIYQSYGDIFETIELTNGYGLISKSPKTESIALFGGNWHNQIISTKLTFNESTFGSTGVIFKAQDEDSYYLVQVVQAINKLKVIKMVDDVSIDLVDVNANREFILPYVALNKEHSLSITTIGNEITVFFDGTYITAVKDKTDPYLSGRAGLRTYNSSATFTSLEVKLLLNPIEELIYEGNFDGGKPSDWNYSNDYWTKEMFDQKAVLSYSGQSKGIATFGDPNFKNYSFKVLMNYQGNEENIKSGIIVRYIDENNYYYVRGYNGNFQLIKVKHGVHELVESAYVRRLATNNWYELELRVIENEINFYLDGDYKMSIKDSDFNQGKVGILADSEIIIKDVQVTALTQMELGEGIELEESYSVSIDKTLQLNPLFSPSDLIERGVYWILSDPSIVTIDSTGLVTPIIEGELTVYAFSYSGYNYDTFTLTVTSNVLPIEPKTPEVPVNKNINPIIITGIMVGTFVVGLSGFIVIKKIKK